MNDYKTLDLAIITINCTEYSARTALCTNLKLHIINNFIQSSLLKSLEIRPNTFHTESPCV